MHFARSNSPTRRRRFGRGPVWITGTPPAPPLIALSEDVRLFASTFAGGFVFVSLLLA